MAKFNPLFGYLRGKLGGVAFARGPFGEYLRGKPSPVNPRSNGQGTIRGLLATLSSEWSQVLTVAERSAWISYANNTPLTDVWGNEKILSGSNMFIRTNVFFLAAPGTSRITAAPTVFGEGPLAVIVGSNPLTGFVVSDSASGVDPNTLNTLDLDNATQDTWDASQSGQLFQIQFSPAVSPGILFFNGPWLGAVRFVGNGVLNDVAVPLGFTVSVGDVVFARFRLMESIGRLSPPIVMRLVAVNIP